MHWKYPGQPGNPELVERHLTTQQPLVVVQRQDKSAQDKKEANTSVSFGEKFLHSNLEKKRFQNSRTERATQKP